MTVQPLHPHQLLNKMAVRSLPGVYILGSFARHVTIFSQQMRAFNLVDALCKTGRLSRGTELLVAGGGIAGVTAAAAAAVRGARVTIVEKEEQFFPLQRASEKRFLHPHIYDWPLLEPGKEQDGVADFPLLGWEVGMARSVLEKLQEKWIDLLRGLSEESRPESLMWTELTKIVYDGVLGRLKVTLQGTSGPEQREPEIVILALGFGREIERPDIYNYWDDTALEASKGKLRWLVSGYGDGGLTDLMRLLIKGFRHADVVRKFAPDSRPADLLKSLFANKGFASVRGVFEKLNETLGSQTLISSEDLREDTEVVFNAPANYLEYEGSSILNRFIVFQLEQHGKITLQGGRMRRPVPSQIKTGKHAGKYKVKFEEGREGEEREIGSGFFDRLVIRHGPHPAINETIFGAHWKDVEELRGEWRNQPQSGDRTRVQIWDGIDFEPGRLPATRGGGAGDPWADVDLRCLTLVSSQVRQPDSLEDLVESAFNKRRVIAPAVGLPAEALRMGFQMVRADEALARQDSYDEAVRKLCEAHVVVVDVTGFEPGVMLFLGIRAAARRGVTLVTTNAPLHAAHWSGLPFNLKELYPLSVRSAPGSGEQPLYDMLAAAAARALRQHRSVSGYQDLPAYEAVRRNDSTVTDADKQGVLWLCSFDPAYQSCEAHLHNGFNAVYSNITTDTGKEYRLERITDIVSPQLVTQRLYNAIRYHGLCLVDWTLWSPNVFFEFGVRLAVSSMGPVCLIAKHLGAATGAGKTPTAESGGESAEKEFVQHEHLRRLFNPIEYAPGENAKALFEEIRSRHKEMQDHEALPSLTPPAFGAFAYNHTYRLVGRHLPLDEEPGAVPAHAFLEEVAQSLVGVSRTGNPAIPVLFATVNDALDKRARSAATELLVAAWHYLHHRYSTDELSQSDELSKAYTDLSYRLMELLDASSSPKDRSLSRRIEEALQVFNKAGPPEAG